MIKLSVILDWFAKQLDRIKTIVIILLIILFSVATINNGCQRQQAYDLLERITGLNVRNDILQENIEEKDSLIVAKERRVQVLLDSLSSSEKRFVGLQVEFGRLEAEYEHLSDSLLTVSVDTSYHFLVTEAYPYPGHLKYPFNEPQVKGIHLSYLENLSLDNMNQNLLAQLDETKDQLELQDTVMSERAEQLLSMRSIRQDQDSIIQNKDEVIQIKDEQINKERRGKLIWKITSGTIAAVAFLIAVFGGG